MDPARGLPERGSVHKHGADDLALVGAAGGDPPFARFPPSWSRSSNRVKHALVDVLARVRPRSCCKPP